MRAALPALFIALTLMAARAMAADPGAVERGRYVFDAAGCAGCHTDKKNKGAPLAGGPALKTPFGTFYGPNITPDKDHGIGRWTVDDFDRALRQGVRPDGSSYFPAFPYTSYTRMTGHDVRDLWAYMVTVPTVAQADKPHDLKWPYGWRPLVRVWKALYFTPALLPMPTGAAGIERGAYLVKALGHCAECHTPRNAFGGLRSKMALAGTDTGPTGGTIPNITPDRETGIGKWSDGDVESLLELGMLPDGDFVGAGMGEVVDSTTGRLTKADRKAIIEYLKSVPPVENRVGKPKKKDPSPDRDW